MSPLFPQYVEALEVSAERTWQPVWFKEWNFEVCVQNEYLWASLGELLKSASLDIHSESKVSH